MKYFFTAGEASGDLHGSNLIKALLQQDPQAACAGWGGDMMQAAGMQLYKHIQSLAFMGIGQVLKNLPTILGNFKQCHQNILDFEPDVLVLIDYSGFNLRIAKWAKQQGIKVFYYISPQIWATREKRIKKIKAYVDKMFVILPFEKAFYERHQYTVEFVGHPLLDTVADFESKIDLRDTYELSDSPIIALLPGSRKQEISAMLPVMLSITERFQSYQFVIAAAPSISPAFYEAFVLQSGNVRLLQHSTYEILQNSCAAIVTSGTATLETALFNIPQIVCYKASPLFYHIVKRIIKVPYISIVNLIMDQKIVEELIQQDCNSAQLEASLKSILSGSKRQQMLEDYQQLVSKLGQKGAAKRAAQKIVESLKN